MSLPLNIESLTNNEAWLDAISSDSQLQNGFEMGLATTKTIHYNRPQIRAMLVGANEAYHVWARGTGKSEGLMAPDAVKKVYAMPRSRGAFVARTYMQLLERTLPPVIKGWEMMGYVRGRDFWVREKPPKKLNIPNPIAGSLDPTHQVYWANGSVISLISQDFKGSANSMTLHWYSGDEAKFLNKQKLDNELAAANRGDLRYFENIPEFHSIMFCTDMPTEQEAKWILEKSKDVDQRRIDLILALQYEMYQLNMQLMVASKGRQSGILNEIAKRKKQWDMIRANTVYYSEASTLENIEAFGLKEYRRLERILPRFIFRTSILNLRLDGDGLQFYPDLSEKNFYDAIDYQVVEKYLAAGQPRPNDCRKDADLDHTKPLMIGPDYNSSINPIVIGQLQGNNLQVINDLHVMSPLRLEDVAHLFVKYYQYYKRKELIYYYDHTALQTNATTSKNYADHFCDIVKAAGWSVKMIYLGYTQGYEERFELVGTGLRGGSPNVPFITFNKSNTAYTCDAMRASKTKQRSKGFEKNKDNERKSEIDQRTTTHFTDGLDTLVIGASRGMSRPKSFDMITS
jgi:hypothetical protein